MLERKVQKRVLGALKDSGAYFINTTSSGAQRRSLPDIMGCFNGRFFGLELKKDNGRVKGLQARELEKIEQAGGLAMCSFGLDQALEAVAVITEERECPVSLKKWKESVN